jgi:hypothetical protein
MPSADEKIFDLDDVGRYTYLYINFVEKKYEFC